MRMDCEIITQDFLPALRAIVAKELASCGLNQKEIASILDISQPAVSQYLRDLRGAKKFGDEEIISLVKSVCSKIRSKDMDKVRLKNEMYSICETALKKQN